MLVPAEAKELTLAEEEAPEEREFCDCVVFVDVAPLLVPARGRCSHWHQGKGLGEENFVIVCPAAVAVRRCSPTAVP